MHKVLKPTTAVNTCEPRPLSRGVRRRSSPAYDPCDTQELQARGLGISTLVNYINTPYYDFYKNYLFHTTNSWTGSCRIAAVDWRRGERLIGGKE